MDKITLRSRSNSSWAAWRDVSPKHNRMVDAMLSAPLHVLASMRVKTELVVEKYDKGKTVPRKVGLQPVMREGIEYEFDVCADMDQKSTMVVTKSRCPRLSGGVFPKPGSRSGDPPQGLAGCSFGCGGGCRARRSAGRDPRGTPTRCKCCRSLSQALTTIGYRRNWRRSGDE